MKPRQPPGRERCQLLLTGTPAREMSEKRTELASKNIGLVVASAPVTTQMTEHFLVVGTAAPQTLELVANVAEQQMQTIQTLVKAPSGEPFFHGRATIFVVPRRYDYSEFAKMIERRDIPNDWTSHWKFDGIDAYVTMVASDRDDEETIQNRLLQPLVSLAVATRGGDVPRWFAEGAGTTTASRAVRTEDATTRDRRRSEMIQAVAATDNAKKFLEEKLTPEQSDLVGAAIMSTMLDAKQRKYFDKMMREISEGRPFEAAFAQSFQGSVAAYVDAWLKRVRGS